MIIKQKTNNRLYVHNVILSDNLKGNELPFWTRLAGGNSLPNQNINQDVENVNNDNLNNENISYNDLVNEIVEKIDKGGETTFETLNELDEYYYDHTRDYSNELLDKYDNELMNDVIQKFMKKKVYMKIVQKVLIVII